MINIHELSFDDICISQAFLELSNLCFVQLKCKLAHKSSIDNIIIDRLMHLSMMLTS